MRSYVAKVKNRLSDKDAFERVKIARFGVVKIVYLKSDRQTM